MSTRIYHGDFSPEDLAASLVAAFHHNNYQVQKYGKPNQLAVQIATSKSRRAGGRTALTANLMRVPDGVSVSLSNQVWLGLAASFGMTALTALRNPLSLFNRLDDIAQDIESVQLEEKVWAILDGTARQLGTGFVLSSRLNRTVCPYCMTANKVAAGRCIACGAPLGSVQPKTCRNCGFVTQQEESTCPNCRVRLI